MRLEMSARLRHMAWRLVSVVSSQTPAGRGGAKCLARFVANRAVYKAHDVRYR